MESKSVFQHDPLDDYYSYWSLKSTKETSVYLKHQLSGRNKDMPTVTWSACPKKSLHLDNSGSCLMTPTSPRAPPSPPGSDFFGYNPETQSANTGVRVSKNFPRKLWQSFLGRNKCDVRPPKGMSEELQGFQQGDPTPASKGKAQKRLKSSWLGLAFVFSVIIWKHYFRMLSNSHKSCKHSLQSSHMPFTNVYIL